MDQIRPLLEMGITLTLLRMGGGQMPPSSFSPVTAANIGISPKNILIFSFKGFKAIPSASPKLLNLNQGHPSKKSFSFQILIKLRL